MKRPYKLEILWSNGVLTETYISEAEKEMLEKYGGEYILMRYELEGEPDARPVSFQVWDEEDNPLFSVERETAKV